MKTLIAGAMLVFLTTPAVTLADMSIGLLRITCVPELRYFEVEAKSYSLLAEAIAHGFENFSPEGVSKRLKLLEQQGLYSPAHLKYTCALPESTYELTATQPPASERGMCGASPTASFSLRVNGKEWFRDVALNEVCLDQASVLSVTISDGKQGWTGRREMIVCLKEKAAGETKCYFLGLPLSAVNAPIPDSVKEAMEAIPGFPITQESLLKEVRKYN